MALSRTFQSPYFSNSTFVETKLHENHYGKVEQLPTMNTNNESRVPSQRRSNPGHDAAIAARGGHVSDFSSRPSSPPIYQTTAFDLSGLDQLSAISTGEENGYIYSRSRNPNQSAFADDLAMMENADAAAVGASGMAVITACVLAFCDSKDHLIVSRALYGPTLSLLRNLANKFGIVVSQVDATHLDSISRNIRGNTRLCLVEGISNPLLEVIDIPKIASLLGSIPLVVDNTFVTPVLQKPIDLGAEVVVHSASKYLNGHGDVMLGVVAGPECIIDRISNLISSFGLNANPFECWLASRGMRTLPIRIRHVSSSAIHLACLLKKHPLVERVFYPGDPEHPSHECARRMLINGFGGMVSLSLGGGREIADQFIKALSGKIPFSPTLADTRTTVSHPATTSHKSMAQEERHMLGIEDGLVRLSIGLEEVEVLESELMNALASLE